MGDNDTRFDNMGSASTPEESEIAKESRLLLAVNPLEVPMMVFLIHIRDPQFYALPATTRAKNGNIRIMGFPPIGIMSLSAVLKRAGHECVMFDQANPETPNASSSRRSSGNNRRWSGLVSSAPPVIHTPRFSLAKSARPTATVKLAFGGVFASLNAPLVKQQCPEVDFVCRGDGEQLILDLLEHLDDPSGVDECDLGQRWPGRQQSESKDGAQPGSVAVPRSREPEAGLRRIHATGRAVRALAGAVHDHADVARLSVVLRLLRYSDLQRREVALADSAACGRRVQASPGTGLRGGLFCR